MELARAVVVRVHTDEDNEHNEPYFVALVSTEAGMLTPGDLTGGESLVWRNTKTQMVESNMVTKGTWLIRIRWLHYHSAIVHPTDRTARCYKLQPGERSLAFPASGVITRKATNDAMLGLTQAGGCYWVKTAMHKTVIKDALDLLA